MEELEKPKKPRTEAQKETIKKAREAKASMDAEKRELKAREKAEKNFEKLLNLFDTVKLQQEASSSESDDEPPPKKQLKVEAPTKREILLRFK